MPDWVVKGWEAGRGRQAVGGAEGRGDGEEENMEVLGSVEREDGGCAGVGGVGARPVSKYRRRHESHTEIPVRGLGTSPAGLRVVAVAGAAEAEFEVGPALAAWAFAMD